jgi:excisionase family DNA binding protein
VSTELATLAADPSRIETIDATALPALIGEAEALRARLWARLTTAAQGNGGRIHAEPATREPERLLTVDEAAQLLGVSRRWVYRHAASLPFARKLAGGTLRFSLRGLERWTRDRDR